MANGSLAKDGKELPLWSMVVVESSESACVSAVINAGQLALGRLLDFNIQPLHLLLDLAILTRQRCL